MAPFTVGDKIEDVVFNVLGFALGTGLNGAINDAVRPDTVQNAGPAWLKTSKGDKLTAGWKPGAQDNKLVFWRKHPGTHVEWMDVEIVSTGEGGTSIRKEDEAGFKGTLAGIRDAWTAFYNDARGTPAAARRRCSTRTASPRPGPCSGPSRSTTRSGTRRWPTPC